MAPKISGRVAVAGVAAGAMALALTVGTLTAFGAESGEIRGADNPNAVDDRYFVVLEPGAVSASEVGAKAKQLVSEYEGELLHSFESVFRGFSVTMDSADAEALAADSTVDYVEQVGTAQQTGSQADPPSWGLDRIDQEQLPLDDEFRYPDGGGKGARAYVVDSGVRMSHDDFDGRVDSGPDFIDNDSDSSDCRGHGTHVAGTVGGSQYGVAKNAALTSVRVLDCEGSGPWDTIVAGLEWSVADAAGTPSVVNMSIGGDTSDVVNEAVKAATTAGMTVVVSAGNNSTDACTQSPASAPSAITVAATTDTDTRADFSNVGECVDLFAPGENITSATMAGDDTSGEMNGTSMAAPHVAGAAALYLDANPDASPQQVAEALVDNGSIDVVGDAGEATPNVLLNIGFLD